ncbi:MAG: efflux RND transporter periplasmic adaptor subunit [Steroidobacteraceae bacterium]
MKYQFVLVISASLALLSGCNKSSAPSASAQNPAQVKQSVVESQLNTITLTPDASQRLGIELATVANKAINRTRVLGGELVSPTGNDLVVVAPFAGVVVADVLPQPGTQLKQGAAVLGLVPINTGDVGGSADNLKVKQAEYQAAANRLQRTEKLLAARGASEEELEQARAAMAQAQATLNLVQAQQELAQGKKLTGAARQAPMPLTSPKSGVLQAVMVAAGQTVMAGQPLFQVQSQQPLWIKVAVFSGDLAEIDTGSGARIAQLGKALASGIKAAPVNGPKTAHPANAAMDVFYRIDNTDSSLRAGELVQVALPLKQQRVSMVVPYSAVYQDMYGSNYVYEQIADHVFVRRRVEVSDIVEQQAILTRGIAVGVKVVTAGVAELAGTEFGVAK